MLPVVGIVLVRLGCCVDLAVEAEGGCGPTGIEMRHARRLGRADQRAAPVIDARYTGIS